MAFSFRLLLPAFEADRVLESIRPADKLFHDTLSCPAGAGFNRPAWRRSIRAQARRQRSVAPVASLKPVYDQPRSIYYNPDNRSNNYQA
jgi:hypothetical protein